MQVSAKASFNYLLVLVVGKVGHLLSHLIYRRHNALFQQPLRKCSRHSLLEISNYYLEIHLHLRKYSKNGYYYCIVNAKMINSNLFAKVESQNLLWFPIAYWFTVLLSFLLDLIHSLISIFLKAGRGIIGLIIW